MATVAVWYDGEQIGSPYVPSNYNLKRTFSAQWETELFNLVTTGVGGFIQTLYYLTDQIVFSTTQNRISEVVDLPADTVSYSNLPELLKIPPWLLLENTFSTTFFLFQIPNQASAIHIARRNVWWGWIGITDLQLMFTLKKKNVWIGCNQRFCRIIQRWHSGLVTGLPLPKMSLRTTLNPLWCAVIFTSDLSRSITY